MNNQISPSNVDVISAIVVELLENKVWASGSGQSVLRTW